MPRGDGNFSEQPVTLTTADRALLQVVTGWAGPGLVASAGAGYAVFPPLAAVLLDARRSGAIRDEVTPAGFVTLAQHLNRAVAPGLRLSRDQMGAGFRHLAIQALGFARGAVSADRARVAAG